MLVSYHIITWHHNTEDYNLDLQCCETSNLVAEAYLIFAYDIPRAVNGVLCLFHIQSINEDGPPKPASQSKWPQVENFLLGDNCTSLHYSPYLS
jgi:hypothetical protein